MVDSEGVKKKLFLQTLFSILSAILLRMQTTMSATALPQGNNTTSKFTYREIEAFKTVSMMQLGFSVTLSKLIISCVFFLLDLPGALFIIVDICLSAPFCVTSSLLYFENLRCDSFSTPYLISVYMSMTNSQ